MRRVIKARMDMRNLALELLRQLRFGDVVGNIETIGMRLPPRGLDLDEMIVPTLEGLERREQFLPWATISTTLHNQFPI